MNILDKEHDKQKVLKWIERYGKEYNMTADLAYEIVDAIEVSMGDTFRLCSHLKDFYGWEIDDTVYRDLDEIWFS